MGRKRRKKESEEGNTGKERLAVSKAVILFDYCVEAEQREEFAVLESVITLQGEDSKKSE